MTMQLFKHNQSAYEAVVTMLSETGNWLVLQRKKYREGTLTADRIEKLDKIGMVWDFNEIWEQHFETAKKFYEENCHLDIQVG